MADRQMPGLFVYAACPMVSETTTHQLQTPGGPLLVQQSGVPGVGGATTQSLFFNAS